MVSVLSFRLWWPSLSCLWLVLSLQVFWVTPAGAHVTSTSISRVQVEGATVQYSLGLNPIDLALATRLVEKPKDALTSGVFTDNAEAVQRYLAPRLLVYGNGRPCSPGRFRLNMKTFPERVAVDVTYTCMAPVNRLLLQYLVFFELDAHHASIGNLVARGQVTDFVLNSEHPEFERVLQGTPSRWSAQAWHFYLLGIEHILIGFDHVLYLLGLIVASLRFRYLITVITMFTLAHTVSLLLAAFGYVAVPGKFVEVAIALSIAYVAVENLLGWGRGYRWAVTVGFGLVHGLGFASVLAALTAAGTTHTISLLTFNMGVETGQLAILAVVLPLLLLLARFGLHTWVMRIVSTGILLMALFWLGERVS